MKDFTNLSLLQSWQVWLRVFSSLRRAYHMVDFAALDAYFLFRVLGIILFQWIPLEAAVAANEVTYKMYNPNSSREQLQDAGTKTATCL